MSEILSKAEIKRVEKIQKYENVKDKYQIILKMILKSIYDKDAISIIGNELKNIDLIFNKIIFHKISTNALYKILNFLRVNKNIDMTYYLLSNIFINPYIFLNYENQFLTYKKCLNIENELILTVNMRKKIESWLCDIFETYFSSYYVDYWRLNKKFSEEFNNNHHDIFQEKIKIIFINKNTFKESNIYDPYKMKIATTLYYINKEKKVENLFINTFYETDNTLNITKSQILSNIKNFEETNDSIITNEEQKNGIINALLFNCSLITGPPGTGKSTIIKIIINILIKKSFVEEKNIFNIAPTGIAAKRLCKLPGTYMTIHKFIYTFYNDDDFMSDNDKLYHINIDESGMINFDLFSDLINVLTKRNCKVVFLGDINQLPPIGAGRPFENLLKCKHFATTVLTKILRCNDSIKNVLQKMINKELIDNSLFNNEITFIDETNFTRNSLWNIIDNYGLKSNDTKILWSVNDKEYIKTELKGKESTNHVLQIYWNNEVKSYTKKTYYNELKVKVHDLIVRKVNDYKSEIIHVNGDTAQVIDIDYENEKVIIQYDDNNDLEYIDADEFFETFDIFYSSTIHKLQGSEIDNIIVTLHPDLKIPMSKNALFTAISRAKKKVILWGSREAFEKSQKKYETRQYTTFMQDLVEE